MKVKAEYIWIDGYEPTAGLRSKTKVLDSAVSSVSELPTWGLMDQVHCRRMEEIVTVY